MKNHIFKSFLGGFIALLCLFFCLSTQAFASSLHQKYKTEKASVKAVSIEKTVNVLLNAFSFAGNLPPLQYKYYDNYVYLFPANDAKYDNTNLQLIRFKQLGLCSNKLSC